MAVGDRIPTELVIPSALSTVGSVVFTNGGSNYRTQITQIFLCNTGSVQRSVTLYKNGVTTAFQIANSIIIPPNGSVILDVKLVTTSFQVLAAKQDTGTDVNIAIYGIVEQIA